MNTVELFVNVEDSSGNRLGSGPITSCVHWRQTKSMDRAGEFEAIIPLADPAAANLTNENVLRAYVVIPGTGTTEIGSGVIDDITYQPTDRGTVAKLTGLDEMRFLNDRSVQFLSLGGSGSPPTVSHATCVAAIMSYAPAGWTYVVDPSPPFDEIIYRYAGESVLQALVQHAQFSKTHFYLSGAKEVTFSSDFTDSGITAMSMPPSGHIQAPSVAYISKFSYHKETKDIVTRIYPYGGWYNGIFSDYFIPINEVNYGLGGGDPDYWPQPKYAGYTDDRTDNWIEKDSAVAIYGRRERQVQYPQVKVTFFTGGYSNEIWRDLCRLIYNRAVAELDWMSVAAEFYTLELQNCAQVLQPLTTIRVIIQQVENGRVVFRVDQNLLILESTIEVTPGGLRTTKLEVTNAERYRRLDPWATVLFNNRYFDDQYT